MLSHGVGKCQVSQLTVTKQGLSKGETITHATKHALNNSHLNQLQATSIWETRHIVYRVPKPPTSFPCVQCDQIAAAEVLSAKLLSHNSNTRATSTCSRVSQHGERKIQQAEAYTDFLKRQGQLPASLGFLDS